MDHSFTTHEKWEQLGIPLDDEAEPENAEVQHLTPQNVVENGS